MAHEFFMEERLAQVNRGPAYRISPIPDRRIARTLGGAEILRAAQW
jgi:hypothetical protein